jgi:hypothetical protein
MKWSDSLSNVFQSVLALNKTFSFELLLNWWDVSRNDRSYANVFLRKSMGRVLAQSVAAQAR